MNAGEQISLSDLGLWCGKTSAEHCQAEPQAEKISEFPLAFQTYGCEPIWASEIEEFPIAVTKKHFPEREKRPETN